jgi:hypothetical protein
MLRATLQLSETTALCQVLHPAPHAHELCEKFGIFNRKAKERGLGFWEEAGIFNVVRKLGMHPLVDLVQPLRIAELASVRGGTPMRCNDCQIRLSCGLR